MLFSSAFLPVIDYHRTKIESYLSFTNRFFLVRQVFRESLQMIRVHPSFNQPSFNHP